MKILIHKYSKLIHWLNKFLVHIFGNFGALIIAVSVLISGVLNYVAQAVPSWYTSQVVYAEYVTLLSFVFLIASTLGTGLSFSIAMNVAQGDENKDDLSLICFVLSIFVNSVASWVFYKIYKHGLWVGVVFWIILNTQILVLLFRGLILGKDKILKYAFFNVLESLLKVLVLIAILVVVVVPTTLSLSVSFMLGLILTVFVYSFYLPKRKYCRALDANYIKSSLRCLVVPFLFVGGTLISLVFGSLYLGNLNKQEAAYLNVIFLVTRLPWYILSSIGTNNIPKLASFNVAVSMKMKFYRDGLKQVVFGGLIIYILVLIVAQMFIHVMFPSIYGHNITFLMILTSCLAHYISGIAYYRGLSHLALGNNSTNLMMAGGAIVSAICVFMLSSGSLLWRAIFSMLISSIVFFIASMKNIIISKNSSV